MQSFQLTLPTDLLDATRRAQEPDSAYIAGGTDAVQLLADDIFAWRQLVDIAPLGLRGIAVADGALRIGAMERMSDAAAHPAVRQGWPVISQALLASASPQVRNMGTMGGNLLQRTRCGYFRDTGFACNKRAPGSGCPAQVGENRNLAVLGGSAHCVATHASDLAVALLALDARLELLGAGGPRTIALADLHRLPGDTPHIETTLAPGELITAIVVPGGPGAVRSGYLKVRDRASFQWAVVSAAVALDVQGGVVRQARVAMGGVGAKPWRLPAVEAALAGQPATETSFQVASAHAAEGAAPLGQNAFKVKLMPRTVFRALAGVASGEIGS